MTLKHEWKKAEKSLYQPKNKPELITIPAFKFFTIMGSGNPNEEAFANYISVLYSLSYAVKMSNKKGVAPVGFFDYSVYPLEGVWDISDEARKTFTGVINKDDLVFTLMIRQPHFVTHEFAIDIIDQTKKKKPHELLHIVQFEEITEGLCVQMLHNGSYDNEPASFEKMEQFATQNNLKRKSKIHKEIYLSDARKVTPEKLKTILRFEVDR